ncbi:hypothetical protein [Sphingobacterium anhuiense]|uniref:hypothetical protein n=1 Tax=Sphingobacterium anhuiense TaxID=493780 RepID=UPI003C2CAEA9
MKNVWIVLLEILQIDKKEKQTLLLILMKQIGKNKELAISFKNTIGGIERIFMTRAQFTKTELKNVLESTSLRVRKTSAFKAIQDHLNIDQIKIGNLWPEHLTIVDTANLPIRLKKNITNIIIYNGSGMNDCMGESNRSELNKLAKDAQFSSRAKIYLFYNTENINTLKNINTKFNDHLEFISDLTGDYSNFKIAMGSQAVPTVYIFNSDGKLEAIQLGVEDLITKWQNN